MKNLFKKTLACCLVVCMVLTLCVGAITVNAENPTGTVVAGTTTVNSGEGTAVIPVEVSAGVAASKVSVKVPANLTITALTLDTADEDVDVTYASAAEPNGKPISLVEATEFVAPYVDAEGVFSYIIHAPAGEVTTAPVIVKISFTGTFVENAEGILVDVEAQAAPDAVVLFDLTITDGKIIVKAAHVCAAARTEQENVNQATCYAEGSYDEVVYCSCGKELSRTPKTIDKIAHTPAEAVVENNKAATCYAEGSYDSVVYCSVEACKFEISRTPVTVEKTEHTPAEAVVENEVAATCLAAGSYESVVYCSVAECKHEISRTTIPVEALKHDYTYKNDGDTHSATCPNGCAGITGEAHNYVDGECVCGAVEVTECKHVHNDAPIAATPAQEDGTKGSIVFHCELCDKDITYDVIYRRASSSPENPSMVLGSTTRMGVTIKQSNAGTKCYFAYTHKYTNGAESTFHAYSSNDAAIDGANYKWSISAYYSQFSDEFVSAMYTYYDGGWTNGLTRVFSIKKAAMAYVTATSGVNNYTKKVAANLLKAGAATLEEFYPSIPAEKYPDVELVGDYAQYVTTGKPSLEKNDTNWIVNQSNASVDGMCGFASPNIKLGELIKIKLTLNPKYYPAFKENGDEALSNMKLRYSYTAYNGVEVPAAYITDFTLLGDGKMEFELNTLATTNLRCPIKFQLFDGDTAASYEVTYSVESILAQIYNSYPKTISAVMNYSDSVVEMQNNQ